MTLRVSRDSGRTYGAPLVYRADSRTPPLEPLQSSVWPPCSCPRCKSEEFEGAK
jgi:predicted Zn-ribbon and HTH transcriptional regulator